MMPRYVISAHCSSEAPRERSAFHLLRRPDRRPALRPRARLCGRRRSGGRGRPSTRRPRNSRPALPPRGSRSARRAKPWATATARARRSAGARDADREDRHGAALHLSRLGAADPATGALHAYVRTLFDQYAPRFDRALKTCPIRRRACCATLRSREARDAFRHHARSRLRHRTRRCRVPAACGLARRRRSVAEDDRGRARERLV